ncbi:uncharacterized protein LOC133680786 [Populus nigra]|uniref:uncharacterized protein LOC133680786 n=1 Tax=Populus nigra TaxID=3691 RepID=UPI002B277D30|nr:uncharacterized protein LOC133680786 [Populus nigra]XP_061959761.1 uncharacterized protein LOC133680786 [Populus nigra]
MMTLKLSGFCDCEGCWRKVNDALSGIKGIKGRLIDKKKFLVTVNVTGTVDTEALEARLAKIRKGVKVEVIFQGDGEKKEEEKKPKEEANFNGPYNDPQPYAYFNGPYNDPQPYAYFNGQYNDPQPQGLADGSGLYNDPQPYAYFNGLYNDPQPYAYFNGSSNDPQLLGLANGSGPYNDAEAGPSNIGGYSTEPMGEQNLEHELARYLCDYGLDYGPHFPFGEDVVPPYVYFNGSYNDPPPQGLADGSGPYSYPPAQDLAHGNGPYNYHPSQDLADEISNACSIM